MVRLSIALFLVQAGFHGFTASLPLALAAAGRNDAEIGALVGIASLVQVAGALLGGVLTDRFGGLRLFLLGGACYLAATALVFFAGTDVALTPLLIAARVLQGAAFGFTVPPALALVPSLVRAEKRGVAIATAGASHNVTLVLLPPLSLIVLDAYGLRGVTVLVAVLVAAGLALVVARPFRLTTAHAATTLGEARRHLGFAFRSSWLPILLVVLLFVVHWGVLSGYLPQRAEAAGANIGLFFAADGLFVLLARIPAGWLADRVRPVIVVVAGIAATAVAITLLFATPTTPALVVAGTLTGLGAALIVQPLMLALTDRSGDADRGSAFALFSAVFAGGIAVGTIGTAPLIESVGFDALLAAALVALLFSALVATADAGLRRHPRPPTPGADDVLELSGEAGTPVGP